MASYKKLPPPASDSESRKAAKRLDVSDRVTRLERRDFAKNFSSYGQYYGNGAANGTSPTSNWSWNIIDLSNDWASFVLLTAAPRTNDTVKFLIAGKYHVVATVHLGGIGAGGWGRAQLQAGGVVYSQTTFSGNTGLQNASATMNAIVDIAVNDVMNIMFTARSGAETILETANDTRSSMSILYLGK